ncbi:Hismacro and SEC14 domain-containing protein [Handroanthus impetiginosus]|uniref:Hismacro and SEC14 domain-containing protein n=1 Tax=Handroanthus impetiginosus TaxID=429701 RepID=A0A2G9GSD6_9LAMI|nr:Hismacro and SEC14 domain-containing protein [Handroanthus impetiginosus]
MTSITPLYSRIIRFFSARNSTETLHHLRRHRGFLKDHYHRVVAVQSLLRPLSVISYPRHYSSGGATVAVGFSTMSSGGSDGSQEVAFQLSPSSVLKIQKGDITRWSVDGSSDAIVNPANEKMLGGGGADGAIHRAAGPELRAACYEVPEVKPGIRCPTGEARITPGFRLPASHVIHTVGPIYDPDKNPEAFLRNAYRNSLRVAKEHNIQYIAFTAISCGVYGYPYEEAATVAISTIPEFAGDFKEVHFVLFSDDIYDVWVKTASQLLQK